MAANQSNKPVEVSEDKVLMDVSEDVHSQAEQQENNAEDKQAEENKAEDTEENKAKDKQANEKKAEDKKARTLFTVVGTDIVFKPSNAKIAGQMVKLSGIGSVNRIVETKESPWINEVTRQLAPQIKLAESQQPKPKANA